MESIKKDGEKKECSDEFQVAMGAQVVRMNNGRSVET